MAQITFNKSNIHKPAPKGYRRFENAYIMVLAPAIIGLIQSWGLTDQVANRATLIVTFSMGLCKFIGFMIANGEDYAPVDKS